MPTLAAKPGWQKVASQKETVELKRYIDDLQFLDSLRQELLHKYPERWVAIYARQIVGAAKTLPDLIKMLEAKQIAPSRAAIDFLTSRKMAMIL